MEHYNEDMCIHQSHSAAWSLGALARPLDGEVTATTSWDHLRNQLQIPGCKSIFSTANLQLLTSACFQMCHHADIAHFFCALFVPLEKA